MNIKISKHYQSFSGVKSDLIKSSKSCKNERCIELFSVDGDGWYKQTNVFKATTLKHANDEYVVKFSLFILI